MKPYMEKFYVRELKVFFLDIDYGNYPYVTSSNTLPYSACVLGFPPQKINNIYGAAKIYDTRSGTDPDFPEDLLSHTELKLIGLQGEEYGTTTGRKRKVNFLNLDKLIYSINISGTNNLILSKIDILKKVKIFKYFYKKKCIRKLSLEEMLSSIEEILYDQCSLLKTITFSDSPHEI
jgi:adenylosuccinate synthase